jgi:SAM-dependent methyltransferase
LNPKEQPLGPDGGWRESAGAWLKLIEAGDPSRELLLDPFMLTAAGDVSGLRVLDVGCGEGRFCRLLTVRGAKCVGLDLTRELLTAARAKTDGREAYVLGSGETLPFRDASFDLVVLYLSLIDIADFRSAIGEAARVLRRGGRLLVAGFSAVASAANGWVRDESGRRLHMPVDRYLEERPLLLEWSGIRILNWHRPLSAYFEAYLGAGLKLLKYVEPMPADPSLKDDPRFEDWFRVPNFDLSVWQKE